MLRQDTDNARVILKPTRQKSLVRRHPWVFSGAIANVDGDAVPGATVDVYGADGECLGKGAWSPHSQIRVRMWTFEKGETVDDDFFRSRLRKAISLRGENGPQAGLRLVNAESDGLPGVVVDRYAQFAVVQFLSTGAERWRETIIDALQNEQWCEGVFERSDVEVRHKEGLRPRSGPVAGAQPPQYVEIEESGCRYLVDIRNGHKTGFYLDQRVNRARVAAYASGARVLNCFSYTGGFGIAALLAGAAHVTNVDSSASALAHALRQVELNNIAPDRVDCVTADVFEILRTWRREGRQFDMVVLDPPKFVESREHLVKGARGYKDVNMLAMRLLAPGGVLATFSCSGLVTDELFQKVVASAACDTVRESVIVERLSQSPDHPVSLAFPEGWYLKGLICRVA